MRISSAAELLTILVILLGSCSNPPTSPKLGVITISVRALGTNDPVKGIRVDILQMNQSEMTDSMGIAAFELNPGMYTVRVNGIQSGGPVLHSIDSTISISAGQADTLRIFDCLMCV